MPENSKKPKSKATSPTALDLALRPGETEAQGMGRVLVDPAVNAACALQSYQGFMGEDISMMATIETIQRTTDRIKGGDLSDLEAMLVSQAMALQTMFTNLARRAQVQQAQRNLEAFLALGLKAQAQSRATISALVDLKYPRQATFVKQANIAHGAQQVNNGMRNESPDQSARARARTGDKQSAQNELLEDATDARKKLDTRATPAASRTDSKLAPVAAVNRATQ
jgi:hypothetical protein